MKILIISWFFFCTVSAGDRKGGETKYKALFQSTVSDCPNFSNDDADATGMKLNDEDSSLGGSLVVKKAMADGMQLSLSIEKYNGDELELMATTQMGLCEAIKEQDAPWAPVFQAMGIEECPISATDYSIDTLLLDMSWADDFLSHEYVAEYFVTLIMNKVSDDPKEGRIDVVCYNLPVSIIEYKEEAEDE